MPRPTKEEFVSSLHAKGFVPDGKGGFVKKNWKTEFGEVENTSSPLMPDGNIVDVAFENIHSIRGLSTPPWRITQALLDESNMETVIKSKRPITHPGENTGHCIIAVDPGSSGGIAWTQPGKGVQAIKMPEDIIQAGAKIGEIVAVLGRRTVAYVERVAGFFPKSKEPDDGKQFRLEGQSHLMFNFGKNYGIVLGALSAIGCKVEIVESKAWQKPLFMNKKGKSREAWKRELRDRAQRIYPGLKVTLNTADALLMLHYAQMKEAPASSMAEAKKGEAV
jgi:hypothetical protein